MLSILTWYVLVIDVSTGSSSPRVHHHVCVVSDRPVHVAPGSSDSRWYRWFLQQPSVLRFQREREKGFKNEHFIQKVPSIFSLKTHSHCQTDPYRFQIERLLIHVICVWYIVSVRWRSRVRCYRVEPQSHRENDSKSISNSIGLSVVMQVSCSV